MNWKDDKFRSAWENDKLSEVTIHTTFIEYGFSHNSIHIYEIEN